MDFSSGGAGGCGAVGKRFEKFHGKCGAGAGVECRSEDRQLQLWARGSDSGGGHYGDVDQSRRHSAYRGVLDTDEKFSFTFTKPGTYGYFCSVHPKMTGKVVVQ